MILQHSLHKSFLRFSILVTIGGILVLNLSRFIPTDVLVGFAKDLNFRYPIQKWQFQQLLRKIDLLRDTLWFCGGGLIISGLLLLFRHPTGLRRFFENIISSKIRTLLFFFLGFQILVVFLFLLTEYRFWWNRMYDDYSPGSQGQRIFLCGREYLHALYISEHFQPGDHVLLAGEQVDPFFLNYYLYPVYLYHYDNRPISSYEIYNSYILRWLHKKDIKYILVYTPYSRRPWDIYTTGKSIK